MLRAFTSYDLEKIMALWLESNIEAHNFIQKDYWLSNYNAVKTMLPNSTIFVYEFEHNIQGFIGLIDNYIAGIFVAKQAQAQGIGKMLLDYAKQEHSTLCLNVYKKNIRATNFYLREKFIINQEQIEQSTNEIELLMTWHK